MGSDGVGEAGVDQVVVARRTLHSDHTRKLSEVSIMLGKVDTILNSNF